MHELLNRKTTLILPKENHLKYGNACHIPVMYITHISIIPIPMKSMEGYINMHYYIKQIEINMLKVKRDSAEKNMSRVRLYSCIIYKSYVALITYPTMIYTVSPIQHATICKKLL